MKRRHFNFLFLLFLSLHFSVLAQPDLEQFKSLPKGIEKIKALQYSIYEGDTISENFFEYNFDEKGNIIHWHYFTYLMGEELKYDSLGRITEIDGVYGESFTNGIINYYYPSKSKKIEIHDKMGFYIYRKSDFIFDGNDRIIGEIRYDSTFNLVDSTMKTYTLNISYSYDKYENLVEELHFVDSMKELIYEMHALYNEKKLLNKTERHSNYKDYFYTSNTSEENFYVTEGEFKDKIAKKTTVSLNENDTIKNEVHYLYNRIDSLNTSMEMNYLSNGKVTQIQKYFYRNTDLIKLEEYYPPKDQNIEPKLEVWTEYSYFFYPKTNE